MSVEASTIVIILEIGDFCLPSVLLLVSQSFSLDFFGVGERIFPFFVRRSFSVSSMVLSSSRMYDGVLVRACAIFASYMAVFKVVLIMFKPASV